MTSSSRRKVSWLEFNFEELVLKIGALVMGSALTHAEEADGIVKMGGNVKHQRCSSA